ncbi:MAG: CDP-alcohol phosphatidyltransferase family protein [Pseudomonadota bacterium]|nr:CDP-alcohol phosphatidyltransferase family protein [Pseudomonadota bacterium]
MKITPWDQQIARKLVVHIAQTPITPNQLTLLSLFLAIIGGAMLTLGNMVCTNWGVGLFVLARFLDHFDGELARQKGMTSRFGYYLDYIAGGLSYSFLFICLGIGFYKTELGNWSIALAATGAFSAIISMFTNLGLDKHLNPENDQDAVGYPGFAGFELEDGIYLIAPITWAGYLLPFFIAAGICAGIYCLWTVINLFFFR